MRMMSTRFWHKNRVGQVDTPALAEALLKLGIILGGGSVDSMLRFWLEGEDDGMQHCWKMKQRQQSHLGSMGRKRDRVWQRGNVSRRRGDTVERKGRR
jgi:hypothetical protein